MSLVLLEKLNKTSESKGKSVNEDRLSVAKAEVSYEEKSAWELHVAFDAKTINIK